MQPSKLNQLKVCLRTSQVPFSPSFLSFFKTVGRTEVLKVHISNGHSRALNMTSIQKGKRVVKHSQWTSFILVSAVKHVQVLPPTQRAHAARWMCRGGLRIVGLITRGQVLDWCPPAVLFYPIRNSICCPTQLLSGHTSHPHRWEHCAFLCVCVCLPLLLLSVQIP